MTAPGSKSCHRCAQRDLAESRPGDVRAGFGRRTAGGRSAARAGAAAGREEDKKDDKVVDAEYEVIDEEEKK